MCKLKTIPLIGIAGMHLTGYSIKDNLTDSEKQFYTLKAIYEEYKPDGLFTFMNLTVEAEALGLKINFLEDDSPSVVEHSIKTPEQLKVLKRNYSGLSGRMELFADVVKLLKQSIDTTVGAYMIGPFSLAGEMNGVNDVLLNTIEALDFVDEMLAFNVRLISDYANSLFEAGADTVCVLEPTAVMLSTDLYERFSLNPFREILNEVDNPLILHICGDTTHLVEQMEQSGASGLSLDASVDFK